MSASILIRCDGVQGLGMFGTDGGCLASIMFETGTLRDRGAMLRKKGWTHGRGVDVSGRKRPRMDWCPRCSKARAKAKKVLGR